MSGGPWHSAPRVEVTRPRQNGRGPGPASTQGNARWLEGNARRLEWFTTEELTEELTRRVFEDPQTTGAALSITCPTCGRTSWNPHDVANGYCGACHATTKGRVTRPCVRCDGCGLVADSEDQEPWTAWTSLPPASGLAVRLGLVHPILCPSCHGRKRMPA